MESVKDKGLIKLRPLPTDFNLKESPHHHAPYIYSGLHSKTCVNTLLTRTFLPQRQVLL